MWFYPYIISLIPKAASIAVQTKGKIENVKSYFASITIMQALIPLLVSLLPTLYATLAAPKTTVKRTRRPSTKKSTRTRTKRRSKATGGFVVTSSGKRFKKGSEKHKQYLKRLRNLKKARAARRKR